MEISWDNAIDNCVGLFVLSVYSLRQYYGGPCYVFFFACLRLNLVCICRTWRVIPHEMVRSTFKLVRKFVLS